LKLEVDHLHLPSAEVKNYWSGSSKDLSELPGSIKDGECRGYVIDCY